MKKINNAVILVLATACLMVYAKNTCADWPKLPLSEHLTPPDPSTVEDGYVYVQDGHLFRSGKRIRLWGVNTVQEPMMIPVEKHGEILDRIKACGFNAIRLHLYDWVFVVEGNVGYEVTTYEKGDDSLLDRFDHFLSAASDRGFLLYMTFDRRYMPILPEAYDHLSGGGEQPAWKEAVNDLMGSGGHPAKDMEMVWPIDERLEDAFTQYVRSLLAHRNQYTGQTYAEEPAIAMWEISNEANFVHRIFNGWFDDKHAYWKETLTRHWNDYLLQQYKSDKNLARVWGSLEPGESLDEGNIALLPLALPSSPPPIHEHQQYSTRRAQDIVAFVINRYVDANKRIVKTIRESATEGRGASVVPIIFDTHHKPDLMNLYSASAGTAASIGTYSWFRTYDKSDPLYPISAMVQKHPGFYGMDAGTVANKPTVVYEINVHKPAYYRSEYPFMVGSFAAGQDWDAVFWYHWMRRNDSTPLVSADLLNQGLSYSVPKNAWGGVVIHSDEILVGALRVMGEAFVRGVITPADKPVTISVGRDALTRPDLQSYWKRLIGISTFNEGSRIEFTPNLTTTMPSQKMRADWPSDASTLGSDVTYAYSDRQLRIDSPEFHAFVGWPGDSAIKFSSGLTFEPDDKNAFVTFAVLSLDGLPIAKSQRLLMTLLGQGENSDFVYDPSVTKETGYKGMLESIVDTGDVPVQISRPKASVGFPENQYGVARFYDAVPLLIEEEKFSGKLSFDGDRKTTWVEIDKDEK